jgi:hypothetical protein
LKGRNSVIRKQEEASSSASVNEFGIWHLKFQMPIS